MAIYLHSATRLSYALERVYFRKRKQQSMQWTRATSRGGFQMNFRRVHGHLALAKLHTCCEALQPLNEDSSRLSATVLTLPVGHCVKRYTTSLTSRPVSAGTKVSRPFVGWKVSRSTTLQANINHAHERYTRFICPPPQPNSEVKSRQKGLLLIIAIVHILNWWHWNAAEILLI
jgi:hypothetical protein